MVIIYFLDNLSHKSEQKIVKDKFEPKKISLSFLSQVEKRWKIFFLIVWNNSLFGHFLYGRLLGEYAFNALDYASSF